MNTFCKAQPKLNTNLAHEATMGLSIHYILLSILLMAGFKQNFMTTINFY